MLEKLKNDVLEKGYNVYRIVYLDGDGKSETAELRRVTPCFNCYSISKAVTATAVGILQDRGRLSVTDSLERYFDLRDYDAEALRKVTLEHLLCHTMGIEKGFLFEADRYDVPTSDWVDYTLRQPLVYAPGEKFAYSNSTFYLLSVVVERVTGRKLQDFAAAEFFEPIGIREFAWETCPMGHTMGATGLYLKTEDLAKFCMLYLQEGLWQGKRLLSEAWCRSVHAGAQGSYYGGFSAGEDGAFSVGGAYGQCGIIWPKKGAVLAAHAFVGPEEPYGELLWDFLRTQPDKI